MELEELDQKTRKLMTMYGAQTLMQMLLDCTSRDVREGDVNITERLCK